MTHSFRSKAECKKNTNTCCERQQVDSKYCLNDCVKKCFCLLLCLGCLISQTQVVSGKIYDSQTKIPISNVNVFIQNHHIGTMTNEEGFFKLFVNDVNNRSPYLHVSMIGYEKLEIPLYLYESEISLEEIMLIPHSIQLESVHIHSHKNKEKQISDIVLTGQELNDNIRGNLAETLSNQSNIGVNSFGVVTSKPVIRGYSGDRFLLIKDGSETGDLSVSSLDHVITLDMNEVNEIEIIRGPKTLLYGSNAIGGVISTTAYGSPKVRVEKFRTKFTFGGESFNEGLYGNIIFYIPFKDNQFNVMINNRITETQTSPIRELDNTYSKTSNYKLGYTKYNSLSYLNFIFENYKMDYGIPPTLEGHISGVDIKLIKNSFQFNYHKDISVYNFSLFDFKYDYIDYEHQEYENNVNYFSISLAKKTQNFKVELQSSDLILGSELNFKKFIPGGFFWTPRTDENDLALYGFYEKNFKSFDLLSAFRIGQVLIQPEILWSFSNLDDNSVTEKKFQYFSTSIGLKKIFHQFEFNTWLMHNMKAPRVEELYSDGPHLGTYAYEIGYPDLKLEETFGLEHSIRYSLSSLNISLSTFYNYSPYYYQMTKMGHCQGEFIKGQSHPCAGSDFIEWGSGSAGWLYKYDTQGVESVIKGVEFNAQYNFSNYNITYDFSYVQGDDFTNNRPLSYINPTKNILHLKYEKELMKFGLRFKSIHSQNRLGEFESATPSAFLVDIINSYSNNNHNITIQLKNIFNQEYYNHLSKIKSIMPEPGINVLINYKLFL